MILVSKTYVRHLQDQLEYANWKSADQSPDLVMATQTDVARNGTGVSPSPAASNLKNTTAEAFAAGLKKLSGLRRTTTGVSTESQQVHPRVRESDFDEPHDDFVYEFAPLEFDSLC